MKVREKVVERIDNLYYCDICGLQLTRLSQGVFSELVYDIDFCKWNFHVNCLEKHLKKTLNPIQYKKASPCGFMQHSWQQMTFHRAAPATYQCQKCFKQKGGW